MADGAGAAPGPCGRRMTVRGNALVHCIPTFHRTCSPTECLTPTPASPPRSPGGVTCTGSSGPLQPLRENQSKVSSPKNPNPSPAQAGGRRDVVACGPPLRCQLPHTVTVKVQRQDVVAQQPGPTDACGCSGPSPSAWLHSCDPAVSVRPRPLVSRLVITVLRQASEGTDRPRRCSGLQGCKISPGLHRGLVGPAGFGVRGLTDS